MHVVRHPVCCHHVYDLMAGLIAGCYSHNDHIHLSVSPDNDRIVSFKDDTINCKPKKLTIIYQRLQDIETSIPETPHSVTMDMVKKEIAVCHDCDPVLADHTNLPSGCVLVPTETQTNTLYLNTDSIADITMAAHISGQTLLTIPPNVKPSSTSCATCIASTAIKAATELDPSDGLAKLKLHESSTCSHISRYRYPYMDNIPPVYHGHFITDNMGLDGTDIIAAKLSNTNNSISMLTYMVVFDGKIICYGQTNDVLASLQMPSLVDVIPLT